jgi:hypothetical protein
LCSPSESIEAASAALFAAALTNASVLDVITAAHELLQHGVVDAAFSGDQMAG